ncbi:MAG: arylamine N-acetyltransferase [Oscillospiraceae bacterium]
MSVSKEQFISEYLERIDYHGSLTPCLETLVALQRQHLYSIPFENLDLLGDSFTPNLDRDYLFDKIVRRRRGGVCYELNTSFYNLLTALGFSACQISGRSRLESPLTGHVFTLVHLEEGDYTADVGYGDDAVPPLNVKGGVVEAYHARYWAEPDGDGLLRLYRQCPGEEPEFQYQFGLTPRVQADYMDTFRFSAAPGNTFFSERPICCRFTPEGKILLRRGILSIEENNRVVESHPVAPGGETDCCLREYFDLP